ncbi:membrane-bound O-acyltransferase family protein [Bacteroides heparinolyticus]|uniref:D-alanyl-lipoteichoic acid acyltransferase DltB (MBOAT superfamily) n=1 Tax=Prevotella heparinolytica TaxID=28113 RepID=A0A2R3MRE7_9BACE|nr:MBOAT family protein [Bacteroides heparinolyticus]AVM57520.1 membrane-bound O-acyltransferase family protein [Bacteroides heparinolyticus]MCF0257679.1 MBOAT family protein [Bacteroides heparinolyticus]RRD91051.1 MBOAT family protein [Bacteroides heparinolyticus]TCO86999.1 D-alanyl-lipoteichoic acid acyltransferase DltB (MBOAT superfamily) [Bacteroides heparinolyticus]
MWNIDEFFSGLDIDLTKLRALLSYDPQAPMIFSSGIFLWLFTAFVLVYLLLQRRTTARLLFVTAFSYYFYYKSSGTYFFLLGLVTVSDFFIARLMAREAKPWLRKAWVTLSLAINLGLLCYFKYTNFLGEFFASITGGTFTAMDIFLPVGISFFTFQSLSYTIDVYRREITPLTNLLDYAFYVSFFPQLVAGPIVRARDFIPQIRRPLFVSSEMFGRGIFLIVSGLFKKAVISDYISINFVERIFDNPTLYSGVENLMGVYGYALQIYCDFSGYSDMAIGIALLLGFHFNINFDSPYKSASVTEFWRRWHISLSGWLRDYLYISLGGNRKGKIRQYANLIITMFLGGLWHGASWNFVLWGMMHGVALALHKVWMTLTGRRKGERSGGIRRFFGILVTFHFVCLCWVFFRNAEFSTSIDMLRQIFTTFRPQLFPQLVEGYWEVFALMALGYFLHFVPDSWERVCTKSVIRLPLLGKAVLMVLVVYLVIQMKSAEIQPFIYFQF